MDLFAIEGGYVKTIWNSGNLITASKLNNIENGILKIESGVNNLSTNISRRIVFARDFGILGQGEDYTEGVTAL